MIRSLVRSVPKDYYELFVMSRDSVPVAINLCQKFIQLSDKGNIDQSFSVIHIVTGR